jgi:hypothetical protein
MTPKEQARYDRVIAARNARKARIARLVADNHTERTSTGVYNVCDRATGQSHDALLAARP